MPGVRRNHARGAGVAMAFIPLSFPVTRIRRVADARDELGNPVQTETKTTINVAGWAVPRTDEPKLAGHNRETVDVELIAPTGAFQPTDAVLLPDRSQVLEVIGEPENYEHNPFGFAPGVEIVNLKGVT